MNQFYQICVFKTLESAFSEHKYDAVFITNPSAMHLNIVLNCLAYKTNIFVEKPLCVSFEEAKRINDKFKNTDSILYVGYQTHFDPVFNQVKNLTSKKKLGDVVSVRFEWCTFLPDHHKYENYRKGYAARRDLGGGVMLGLSHEIDAIISLFGMPNTVKAIETKNKKLDINADDTVMVLFGYSQKNQKFPLSLILSYSQVFETRNFKIQFEDGLIDCDLNKGTLSVIDRRNLYTSQTFDSNLSRNDIFLAQTKNFMNAVINKDTSIINIDKSLDVLNLIDKIRQELK